MNIPDTWFVESVQVETNLGQGFDGTQRAPLVTVLGNVDSRATLTRTADGDEVTAQQVLRFLPAASTSDGDTVDPLVVFTPDSLVNTYGRDSLVLTVKPFTIRGVIGYVEVTTT